MHFWAPDIDPAHPMECTQAERYAVRRLDNARFLTINPEDQRLQEVGSAAEAYLFHTHEAALRAAQDLNQNGLGPVDVVKVEWEPAQL
ncbi:hypothetical protein [Synechococcus sp. GFB01]|uniref:hypothetical protein n=1 Tax=Synechococcus sp. GFB01 TaxID=1662190 RepID=UPI00064E429D|nr:hypothetical protein [Synechococcus sp. GFB01]KMM17648.1 hypothetical protein SYNGFB01_02820 [Synechococcus sp. GFB01]